MKISKIICLSFFLALVTACQANSKGAKTAQDSDRNGKIVNYDSAQPNWVKKLHALKNGEKVKFRIIQLGDSHTAGDYFSDEVRNRLQRAFGNGGIGWVAPAKVSGQRNANVGYQNSNWEVITSRKSNAEFPLGGVIARSNGSTQHVTINKLKPSNEIYNITFTLRSIFGNGNFHVQNLTSQNLSVPPTKATNWTHLTWQSALPFNYYTTDNSMWEVGQINIENQQAGIVYSAMGINGAQLTNWKKWRTDWMQDLQATEADLVILSYGTNEAMNNNIHIAETKAEWVNVIQQIHRALPKAGVLIIGAPESLLNFSGKCGTRPQQLSAVQNLQQNVAQQTKAMYWSWQAAMGGECSMKDWVNKGWARKDGVHFTEHGYQVSGTRLADEIIKLAN